jgi:acyl-CoA reductase-like NAD-dependent aldehyde dehydrogenase
VRTQNYIDGGWRGATGGRTFPTYNPTSGEVLAEVARSTPEDVDQAVAAAAAAWPRWRRTPAPLRANYLYRVAELAQDREDELSRFICREHGKTLVDAHGDVQELIHVALYWAGEGRRQFGSIIPSEKRSKLGFSRREPLGVVAALLPWNFALTKAALKIFPAIVLGNTVVHKPARETPLIGGAFQELLDEAELPPGVVNLVQGFSDDIGDRLVGHPDVSLVTYTGQTEVGRRIAATAGARLARVSLELSAKNALVVNEDADLSLALEWALLSAFATNGQRETAASRIFVHQKVADTFKERFVAGANRLRIGDPLSEATEMGPLISREQVDAVDDYVRRVERSGGRILCGGRRPDSEELRAGCFYLPTVFGELDPSSPLAAEEVLGPTTSIYEVPDLETALALANRTPYGLSMAIFSQDIGTALAAAETFETGVAWVNAGTVGAEVGLPFGGTKATGIGTTEWGQGALDTFSRWKTTYVNYGSRLSMVFEDTRIR